MTVGMVMSPLPESRLVFPQHLRITTGHIGRGRVSWQQLYKAPPASSCLRTAVQPHTPVKLPAEGRYQPQSARHAARDVQTLYMEG